MAKDRRPAVATIFGILNVVFGSVAFIIGIMSISILSTKFDDFPLTTFFGLFSLIVAAVETFTGILMITNKKKATLLLKSYLILGLVSLMGNIVADLLQNGKASISTAVFATAFGLAYLALQFFLVLKSEPVKSFYDSQS